MRRDASDRRRRSGPGIAIVAVLCSVVLAGGSPRAPTQSGLVLEGDPFRGRELFVEKLCVQCHSVLGTGGTLGPAIVRAVAGKTLSQLSGEFWNHTPRMIEEISLKGYGWPTLARAEMADLLSYLYYVRLFDPPGDVARGATAYERFRCGACHTLGGSGTALAQPVDRFSAFTSPVPLAQAMWNAGPAMRQAQIATGVPIPQFIGDEMLHLQAFVRDRGFHERGEQVELLLLPDPSRGQAVFHAKRCDACHGSTPHAAPELADFALHRTVAEIAGILWNHSFAMQGQMRAAGIRFPQFADRELADLIGYLHLVGYRAESGDPSRGAEVFVGKGCATCHQGQPDMPDLSLSVAAHDALALSASMWNHAPQMHDLIAERDVAWPKFEKGEMEDLTAFLRQKGRSGGSRTKESERGAK